jgi:serine-type D-Ala-D-Ala carboxypeptidase
MTLLGKMGFFGPKWRNSSGKILCLLAAIISLLACSNLPLTYMPSKNYSERIKFLVMHYTAIDYQKSVKALVDEGGLSAHYLIPERQDPSYKNDQLEVIQLVPESSRAWHAGDSFWQGREDLNDQSIGIEIVNVPECMRDLADPKTEVARENDTTRLCVFPDYDPKQIELLVIQTSRRRVKMTLAHVFHGFNYIEQVLGHGMTTIPCRNIGRRLMIVLSVLAYCRAL